MGNSRMLAVAMALAITLLFAWHANFSTAAAAEAAGAPVCGGRDLIALMQQEEPDRYQAIVAAEKATINGNALLWKVEKTGAPPSFLYGTMHTSDKRLTELPPAASEALEASRAVALELSEIVDEEKFNAETVKNLPHIAFLDGRSIDTILSPADLAALKSVLATYQMPYVAMRMMKPWFLSVAMALPLCELERKQAGIEALDVNIGRRAAELGVPLIGLETVAEQFGAFDAIPLEDQKNMLVSALRLQPMLDDQIETMTRLYAGRRLGAFWEFTRQLTIKTAEKGQEQRELAALERFRQELVVKRNRIMAERAQPLLDEGGAFIAVGAMHLPDEDGIIDLLHKAGYRVSAVY